MKYFCNRIGHAIPIDGNINKKEWQGANEVFLADTVTGCNPRQPTTVRLLWDDNHLYAVFQCIDNYIHATMTGYNEKLYEEEVVELFIDDDGDRKTYLEIEVNPSNARLHYSIQNRHHGDILVFGRIDSPIRTAVIRNDEKGFWSVEIAIPFSEFATAKNVPPQKGDRWLMNLYRIDRPRDGRDEYSAWSPTGKVNFHLPESFGELVFT